MALTSYGQKSFLQMRQKVAQIAIRQVYGTVSTASALPDQAIQDIINEAYTELCSERDWWFMFNYCTFTTVALQTLPYTMPGFVAEVRTMAVPSIQRKIRKATWDQWITNYPGRYLNVGPSTPWAYIEAPPAPTNELQYFLFPQADANGGANYIVEYGYKQRITPLYNDDDQPVIPVEFQECVINRAIAKCFRILNDPRFEQYSGQVAGTEAKWREDQMWLKNESMNDYVNKFRNFEIENAFVSSSDVGRQLFVPF